MAKLEKSQKNEFNTLEFSEKFFDTLQKSHIQRGRMATVLDPKLTVTSQELLMSQVVSPEAIIRLLVEKGIFSKEEFLAMVEEINLQKTAC